MSMRKCIVIGMVALLLCMFAGLSACVNEEEQMGEFYSLQTAYDEGWLTIEDLQTIAFYHNDSKTSYPKTLSEEIARKIKEVAARNMREDVLHPVKGAKAADFSNIRYYGTYDACVVIMIKDPYHEYPAEDLDIDETIANVTFHYTDPNRIIVWRL